MNKGIRNIALIIVFLATFGLSALWIGLYAHYIVSSKIVTSPALNQTVYKLGSRTAEFSGIFIFVMALVGIGFAIRDTLQDMWEEWR